MSAPIYSVPSTYAPPASPHFASTPQSPQPPQSIPPFEQAILDLNQKVDDFVAEQKGINAHSNQRIITVEDNLNKELDGLKNDFEHKWDNLQDSIENLIDQQQCPPEEECLSDTMVEEQCQQQLQEGLIENFESSAISVVVCPWEKNSPMLTEEGSGKETGEELIKLILQPIPINLDPNATAKPKNSPLPVHILLSPAVQSTPKTPTTKATQFAMPTLQNFKTLVATIQAYATTSKTLTVAYVAWHSGWFGCWFGFGAPEPRHC